jgi:hypothetical protein
MKEARNVDWVRHLLRYQHQLRTEARRLEASDIEVLKVCAALVLTEQRPSAVRIAHESTMVLGEKTVQRIVGKLESLGIILRRGGYHVASAPATWQGYQPHAADPAGLDRHVAAFAKDLDSRIAALLPPPKRRSA